MYNKVESSNIVFFDTGNSYVVRTLPASRKAEGEVVDRLDRTFEDITFIAQYEEIFLASSRGDLATCKKVIKQGFKDVNAVSYGRYGTESGCRIQKSPLSIAQFNGHQHVIDYFNQLSKEDSKQSYTYNSFKNTYLLASPTKSSNKVSTNDIIRAILSNKSDVEICDLLEDVEIEKDEKLNPIDYISRREGVNIDEAVQIMACKYPITHDHLYMAMTKHYNSSTVRMMLMGATYSSLKKSLKESKDFSKIPKILENTKKEDGEFDTKKLLYKVITQKYPEALVRDFILHAKDTKDAIYWLFSCNYSENLIALAVEQASSIEDRYLIEAIQKKFSSSCLELLVAKVNSIDMQIWNCLFPCEDASELAENFLNKPKPYLPNVKPYTKILLKQMIEKTQQENLPCLTRLIGQASDEIMELFQDNVRTIVPYQLGQLLKHGYSENLILKLLDRINQAYIHDNALVQIAKARGYSLTLISRLEKMCPTNRCVMM